VHFREHTRGGLKVEGGRDLGENEKRKSDRRLKRERGGWERKLKSTEERGEPVNQKRDIELGAVKGGYGIQGASFRIGLLLD